MRSLSVPDHLGKVADEIRDLEVRLGRHNNSDEMQDTLAFLGKPHITQGRTSRSCVDLKKLQEESEDCCFSFLDDRDGENHKDDYDAEQQQGFLPGYQDAMSTPASAYDAIVDENESLGLAIDGSCGDSCSNDIERKSPSLAEIGATQHPEATSAVVADQQKQQKAMEVVEALSDMFCLDLGPVRRVDKDAVEELVDSSASPTSVMNIPPSVERKSDRIGNDTGDDYVDDDDGFRMLSTNDRSLSLPTKLPAPRVSLKPSLKSSNSVASQSSFGSLKRTVSFGTLKTREYNISISDHPSCSYGPPISLGWEFTDKEAVAVEEYENQRLPRRTMEQMVLSYNVRRYLLLKRAGYSKNELKTAIGEVERVKRQRFVTDLLLPTSAIDETMEDVIRRIKGMFTFPNREDEQRPNALWTL